ncbi:MAG: DUF3592 domain-containing protein [Prosthecobacter sp.]
MQPALPWFLRKTKSWKGFSAGTAAGFVLFCLTFLAFGLFGLWSISLQPTLNWARARSWQPADAVMEAARLERSVRRSRSGRYTYKVEAQFRYQYHGVEHTGTRHSFVSVWTNKGVPGMRQVVDSLPSGKKVTCWVNPGNPAECVLDRSLPAQVGSGLFEVTSFIAIGMAGLGFLALPLLRRRFRARRQAQLAGLVATGRLPQWVLRPFAQASQAPKNKVALVTAADERLAQMLGLLLFNLFWNGLVGAFVLEALLQGEIGTELSASLILTPFVAVGILLLWMLMKSCRCQRRPQWVAAVHPAPGFGGGTVRCCWAWLEESRSPHVPQAVVRMVAQAGMRWRKLLPPGTCRKGQRELDAVEIPIHSASGEISVTLPRIPSLDAETAKRPRSRWMWPTTWCRWWQLEVAYADGGVETAPMTKAVKLK